MTALAVPEGLVHPGELFVPPAHLWVPEHAASALREAEVLMSAVGRHLDPEQRLCLDAMYAVRPDGKWAAFEVGVVASRQNLKSYTFEAAALTDLFMLGDQLITWTAHLFRTTQEAFRNLRAIIDAHDFLGKRVLKISTENGNESIELRSGQRLMFMARSKTAGRGMSGDKVFLDEALFLSGTEMGSLLPTVSARPNPQIRYGSSAGVGASAVLRRLRNRGRRGGDPFMAWAEWCAPGSWREPGCRATLAAAASPEDVRLSPCTHAPEGEADYQPGCSMDRRDYWAASNPAMNRRVPEERIASERAALPVLEFGRERMGWWEEPVEDEVVPRAINVDLWEARLDPESYPTDPVALYLDVAPNATSAAVAIAAWRPDGRKHVEVLATGHGAKWVVPFVADTVRQWRPLAVGLDGGSEAGQLTVSLRSALAEIKARTELKVLGSRDVAAAAGMLATDVREDGLRHLDQQELADAVDGSAWRKLAGAQALAKRDQSAVIAPLVAVSGASWLLVDKTARKTSQTPTALPAAAVEGLEGAGTAVPGGDVDVMSVGF